MKVHVILADRTRENDVYIGCDVIPFVAPMLSRKSIDDTDELGTWHVTWLGYRRLM